MKRDLLRILDLSGAETEEIFRRAAFYKKRNKSGRHPEPLRGKSVALIFRKPSTRTRISFGVGISELGGTPHYLDSETSQMGRGETVEDTAMTLSRYVHGIVIRTFSHGEVVALARAASVPVINGLTDLHHPCQVFADVFTLLEKRGRYRNLTVAYVGDSNNVTSSLIEAAALLGFKLNISSPPGYGPDLAVLKEASALRGSCVEIFARPEQAVRGADAVYTDVWVSMGQESEKARKLKAMRGFGVSEKLIDKAGKDCLVMHCMPIHRGEEISASVADGPRSVILDQAENRLHVQKAIMEMLLS